MPELPAFSNSGDLPVGIHPATLAAALARFGTGSRQRVLVGKRLERLHQLVVGTGQLARCVVFGSFVTSKPDPNDVDLFLLMEDNFDAGKISGEVAFVFDHPAAQAHFGASVFWTRRFAALGGEQAILEDCQVKSDGSRRGIVELIWENP